MIALVLLLIVSCSVSNGRVFQYGSNKDWDVILFTQNWPVTECLQFKQDKPDEECNSADYAQWTVHGMWPTKLGTKGPGFCDREMKFELNEIESIVDELTYRWLSIRSGNGQDADFWKHEWEKHGTCAVALENLDSELKYFNQGLNWNTQYNMKSILQQIGMKPGGPAQTIDTLYNNVQSITGTNPFISCYTQKNTGKTYLIDVRLCFDKTLTLVDCDGVQRREDEHPLTQDCPDDSPIHYPDEDQLYQDDFHYDNYLNE